jgi:hypothetical protein
VRAGTAQSQERARRLALDPGTWSRDEAAGMAAEFDAMAASWEGDRGRVMADDAVLVWSNALGACAPFHLPTEVLIQVMTVVTGRAWDATGSEAYWGSWAVLRAR